MADIELMMGGESYRLRPSYGAMREIEGRTGLTFTEIYELACHGRLKIEELVTIIWHACQAAGEELSSRDAVGGAIFDIRVTSPVLNEAVMRFVLECLWTPEQAKKKFAEDLAPMLATGSN